MFNYSVDLEATFPSVQVALCVCSHASCISLFLEARSVPFYALIVPAASNYRVLCPVDLIHRLM